MGPSSKMCLEMARAAEVRAFGQTGSNASGGFSGKNGNHSDNLTIFADGSPLTLNLAGEDGQAGQEGQPGEDGDCQNQPTGVKHNLIAPSGGNGGNGGNGGDGGNGGYLTLYATDTSQLQQIFVNASGGKGGQSGKGGLGGQGCR